MPDPSVIDAPEEAPEDPPEPEDLFEEVPVCKDGAIRMQNKPGHGMSLARDALKKYKS